MVEWNDAAMATDGGRSRRGSRYVDGPLPKQSHRRRLWRCLRGNDRPVTATRHARTRDRKGCVSNWRRFGNWRPMNARKTKQWLCGSMTAVLVVLAVASSHSANVAAEQQGGASPGR